MSRLDEMVDLLEKMGPLDAFEIAHEMGILRQNVDTLIRRARKRGQPRRVYIAKYLVAPEVTKRTKLWAAGNKPDARTPTYEKRAAGARSDKRRRAEKKMLATLHPCAGDPFGFLIAQVSR